jgi:hypothetical protein
MIEKKLIHSTVDIDPHRRTDWSIQYIELVHSIYCTTLILQLHTNITTNKLIKGLIRELIFFIVAPIAAAPALRGVPIIFDGVIVQRVGGVPVVGAGSLDRFLLWRDLLLQWKVISWWGGFIVIIVSVTHPLHLQSHCGLLCPLFFSVIVSILALGSHRHLGYEECCGNEEFSSLYGVTGVHSKEVCPTVQWRGVMLHIQTTYDYGHSSDGQWWHSSDGSCWHHHCLLLLWSSVITGVADISFHPSQLTSWAADIKVVRCCYGVWSQ